MPSNPLSRALVVALVLAAALSGYGDDARGSDDTTVRVRIAGGESSIPFETANGATVASARGAVAVPPGATQLNLERSTPPRMRYHLIGKTFLPHETAAQADFVKSVEADGFTPVVLTQGRRFATASGKTVDNRMFLVSIMRADTRHEADRAKKELQQRKLWCYVVPEVLEPGSGTVRIQGAGEFNLPVTLVSDGPIQLTAVDTGYWHSNRTNQQYEGTIDVDVGPDGKLMLIEALPLESYLAGVLPAEMPSEWPLETLKAQAIAARSEVLASAAGKHVLDGYDFCGTEHCRAYLGSANGEPRTDRALHDTRGRFLVHGDRIVSTVFSATCGGWTEDNDAVWSGRAQPALRGVADAPASAGLSSPRAMGVWKWLDHSAEAYCRGDETYFRWRRSFTASELTAIVSKFHDVGRVQSIETGERGVSGRLKAVKIRGSKRDQTIYKELPIRQVFGGLPSALFVVSTSTNSSGETLFTFIGAGRGHGVGLCQNGARGMAAAGFTSDDILTHYFTGAVIERFK